MSTDVPRLHVEIDTELHRRAKIVAARNDLTLKQLITDAVEQFVDRAEADEAKGR
jgi:predicted transcriptional regulator